MPIIPEPNTVPQTSARQKLELSRLTPGALQREMMGDDVDIKKLSLYLSSQIIGEVSATITGAHISRSIQGSSELRIDFNDPDRILLTSGFLNQKLDVQIDGLWFRLAGVDKSADTVTLTFEDREISLLRSHANWKIANRSQVTRAQFILSMIREVTEVTIPVQIPELNIIQPVEKYPGDTKGQAAILNKQKGIDPNTNIHLKKAGHTGPTIKVGGGPFTGSNPASTITLIDRLYRDKVLTYGGGDQGAEKPASRDQITNANTILNVGDYMGVKRKLKVCAIMTALVENSLTNTPGGDGSSVGIFQQTPGFDGGMTFEERYDVATAAKAFYDVAIKMDKEQPDATYGYLCQLVQVSAYPLRYQQHQTQAEKYVTAFGSPGDDHETSAAEANGSALNGGAGGAFYYWRGNILHKKGSQPYRKPENSWSCIQRLAGDVDWAAFFVSGVFWYISEDALFKQQPLMYLFEGQDGIIGIDGSYRRGAKSGTLTVTAHAGRWIVPPGSLVVVENMGPWNGRWLVSQFDRDLFTTEATITLIKPRPELPEPISSNLSDVKNFVAQPVTGNIAARGDVGVNGGQRINFNPGRQDAAVQAQQLLEYWAIGKWKDDNGLGLQQIRDTANHIAVTNVAGTAVGLDWKPIATINWLISQGFTIGTYAWCHDHHFDSLNAHAGGHAVDISSINGQALNSNSGNQLELATRVATLLNNLEVMQPKKLITAGVGYQYYQQLEALCIPSSQYYYGNGIDSSIPGGTNDLPAHRNHIHMAY
jgi:hypothetical protein